MNAIIKEIIIDAARGAPSGHNSQPWKFEIVNDEKVIIHPDFTKKLEVVDPENKEFYISIGCLLEAFVVAASNRSIECNYEFQTEKSDDLKISEIETKIVINLKKVDGMKENPLYPFLKTRQTNRSFFKDQLIDDETMKKLNNINKQDGINLYSYSRNDAKYETLKSYVSQGNDKQLNDANFKKELISFMRFNDGQIKEHQDGLIHSVFGMPALPAVISRNLMKVYLAGNFVDKDDLKKISSASHLFVFTSKVEEDKYLKIEKWIRLGIELESFLLTIASIDKLAVAFNNQPCEVGEITKKFQDEFFKAEDGTITEVPDILVRVGYVDKLAVFSPRKELDRILINN